MKRKSVWGITLKDGTLQTGMPVFSKRSESEDAIAKISHLSDGFEVVELAPLNSPEIPDGWVMVPKEPTADMLYGIVPAMARAKELNRDEYDRSRRNESLARWIFKIMLESAPKPEK